MSAFTFVTAPDLTRTSRTAVVVLPLDHPVSTRPYMPGATRAEKTPRALIGTRTAATVGVRR